MVRRHNRLGMRVESDGQKLAPFRSGDFPTACENGLMSPMDTVESPDTDHRGAIQRPSELGGILEERLTRDGRRTMNRSLPQASTLW